MRGFQGFRFGGEWAAGSVLMGEVIRGADRGKAVGTVQSAWAWGWGAAAILATIVFQVFRQEIAWRALFFVGILPALLVFYIRTKVPEPAVSEAATQSASRRGTFEIFSRELLPAPILGAALATGAQGGYYAISTFQPTFLRTQRHLTVMGAGGYLAVIIVGSWFGYVVSAYLSDAIGRRKNFFIFAIGSLLIAVAYTQTEISDRLMLVMGFPLGFFTSDIFSGMGPVLTELFPTSVRGTGQGFCYNFGRGIGAFFPTLVGFGRARHRDRHLCSNFLRQCHPRGVCLARNSRARADGELKACGIPDGFVAGRHRFGHFGPDPLAPCDDGRPRNYSGLKFIATPLMQ